MRSLIQFVLPCATLDELVDRFGRCVRVPAPVPGGDLVLPAHDCAAETLDVGWAGVVLEIDAEQRGEHRCGVGVVDGIDRPQDLLGVQAMRTTPLGPLARPVLGVGRHARVRVVRLRSSAVAARYGGSSLPPRYPLAHRDRDINRRDGRLQRQISQLPGRFRCLDLHDRYLLLFGNPSPLGSLEVSRTMPARHGRGGITTSRDHHLTSTDPGQPWGSVVSRRECNVVPLACQ